jgi:eukaryotic-like serine/threonine-protein kinase
MASKKQAPVFSTTGETYTSEGIEGEAGTSVIYRVIDSEGNRWALKCLKPDQATTSRTKRFLNELNFCLNSSHKNVVRVVDRGFVIQGEKKCPFYVMPLYPSTLRKLMQEGVPCENAMHYFSEVLDGVEAAHLKNVWHRDLKPENVLHDPATQRLVVSDFGVAQFTAEAMYTSVETRPQERLANFQYAAPEQRTPGGVVDQRADIYALGLILNEMFTGQVPQGVGFRQISQIAPELAYLDEIVDRMVQHSSDSRPRSIDEIKQILIARKNDFVSRQKLDQLRQTVVPSSTITDALVENPPQIRSVDVRGDTLTVELNRAVTPEWVRVFKSIRNYQFFGGCEPPNWSFSGTEASVSPPRHVLDTAAQHIVDHFKSYIESANVAYRQQLENHARQQEEAEKRTLQERIAEEERRQRILQNLKI